MTKLKLFADTDTGPVLLNNINRYADGWYGFDANNQKLKATRHIHYKSNPSKHKCDVRCTHASGKTMSCECSCGGENHGRGH